MGLADKFGNFKVKQTDRISKEDKEWLDKWEQVYKRALLVYKAVYDIYRSEYMSYSDDIKEEFNYSKALVSDFGTLESIDSLQDGYISRIFSYFQNKYNVTLENDFPHSNLSSEYYLSGNKKDPKELVFEIIDYHRIVDNIIEQLGGMNFQDKAMKEIKDKLKDKCYNRYNDTWDIKLKGNKVTFTNGYCSQSWSDNYYFNSVELLRSLFDALAFNAYGEKRIMYSLGKLNNSYHIELDDDDFKNGFDCNEAGIKHIKFFKNGRFDITLESGEFARNFVKEWCGYTLV